jgi:hypothetical protein
MAVFGWFSTGGGIGETVARKNLKSGIVTRVLIWTTGPNFE